MQGQKVTFVDNNLPLILKVFFLKFVDADCNIHKCQLGQIGFFDMETLIYQPWDPDVDIQWMGLLVSTTQCRVSQALCPSCWQMGSLQRPKCSGCHCSLSRTGWGSSLIIYVSISGKEYCCLIQKGNPRRTCVDTNWSYYSVGLSSFLSKSYRCQMRGSVCKFVLRYFWVDEDSYSLPLENEFFFNLVSFLKIGEPGTCKGPEVQKVTALSICQSSNE